MNSYSANFLSNGTGTSQPFRWPGGKGFFSAAATFGGGFINLEYLLPDGTSWGTAGNLTANGGVEFDLPPGTIRAVCNTATAAYVMAAVIPE